MSSDPNYRPNNPNQNTTHCTNVSSEGSSSTFNAPPLGKIHPSTLPPRPPFPPSQLQRFQCQPSTLDQKNTLSVSHQPSSSHPSLHLPSTHFPSPHLPPTHLPPPNLQSSHHPPPQPLPSKVQLSHPPPQCPPLSHPPPNHPRPQLVPLNCPPPNFLPPPPLPPPPPPWLQAPSSIPTPLPTDNSHLMTPIFNTNQQQLPLNYREKTKISEIDQTNANKSNIYYNKLSVEDINWLKDLEESKDIPKGKLPLEEKFLKENKKIKLSNVTLLASESQALLKTLANLKAAMEQNASTATPEAWQSLMEQVEQTKEKFDHNIIQLLDPHIMKIIQNRRRKRERLKSNKKKLKEENHNKLGEWKQKEVEIDIWRECIIKKEKDELREKKIKEEADSVLSEIRFKQTEASRMIQLLDALKKLRKTRTNKGDQFGYVSNSVSDNSFANVMSKMQGLVSSHLSDYKLEEATLKVMMEESGSKHSSKLSNIQDRDTRPNEVRINNFIFGQNSHKTVSEDFDIQQLVFRRHEWDEFLTSEENPLGSSMPPGWVVPPMNPSQQWAEFLNS